MKLLANSNSTYSFLLVSTRMAFRMPCIKNFKAVTIEAIVSESYRGRDCGKGTEVNKNVACDREPSSSYPSLNEGFISPSCSEFNKSC